MILFFRICNWFFLFVSVCFSFLLFCVLVIFLIFFFEAKLEKKLVICWFVRNSVLLNSRSLLLFFVVFIILEIFVGFIFCLVCSLIWNLVIKYFFCLFENRVLRVWEYLRVYFIGSDGLDDGDDDIGKSLVFCILGIVLVFFFSFDAYFSMVRLRIVLYLSVRLCFLYLRCFWSELWYW